MHHDRAIRANSAQPRLDSSTPALLKGRLLIIARAAWLLIAALSVGLFIAGVPFHYRQLLEPCESGCAYFQLSPEQMLALETMGSSPGAYAAYHNAISIVSTLAFVGVAFLIFWRRSGEWVALLASLWLVTFGTMNQTSLAFTHSQPLLLPLWAFLDQLGWVILLPIFLLTFPDGRFIPRWTLWVYLGYITFGIAGILIDSANALPETPNPVFVQAIWFATQITGVGSQVYRYLRVSDPLQRQQTKWVVFGLVTTVLILSLHDASNPPDHLAKLVEITVVSGAFLIIPLSLGVSILRYQLWDIDVIINRALVWGLLSGLVVGGYVLSVGGLGALFQSRNSLLPSVVTTGLIALLFNPLRQRVQRGVNRLMYGDRDDPYSVLSQLGRQLETTLAPDAVLPTVVETVAQTLKLPYAAITLKEGDEFQVAASTGGQMEDALVIPLTHSGEIIGEMICGSRRGGRQFNSDEKQLLTNISRQTGVAFHAVRLTADLQRARERLVVMREEERRRIRRDLHDELGPALASQTLKIGSARSLLRRDPEAADVLLRNLETDTKAVLENIRRLVHNLRPPALDELGLLRAIEQSAPRHQDLKITFDLPSELPELAAAVEVAVYRVVQEALVNIVRHAHAKRATVAINVDSGFRLTITDDGQGMPAHHRSGVGLRSMRDRAEELGGVFRIHSTQGIGTTIEVRLPLRGNGQ